MDQPQQQAHSVLIEVMNVLGAFKDHLVIVGGWVPELTYPDQNHIGSIDVDLAVSPDATDDNVYQTIFARLKQNSYSLNTPPTHFIRQLPDNKTEVKVDLISGEYVNDDDKQRLVRVNELQLNTLRGIDLAFEHSREIEITGKMPDGSQNTVRARVVIPEAFILIKAFALSERLKEKDAYDIAFVLANYRPNIVAMAETLSPIVSSGLGLEAITILREKFATLESIGPTHAANVYSEIGADFDQSQQAAFQNAQELFAEINKR